MTISRTPVRRRICALLWLGCFSCGGDPVRGRGPDAGVVSDGGAGDGGGAPARDGSTACSTPGDCEPAVCPQGDLLLPCAACADGYCAVCDDAQDCRAASPAWNACTADGACVECETDEDCAVNPDALGPSCAADLGFCTCAADGDCEGNPNGAACVPQEAGYCGCAADEDCPGGRACETVGGIDTCR